MPHSRGLSASQELALNPFAVPISHVALATLIAVVIALVARRRSLLNRSGAVAATFIGPALVASGGWWVGAILVTFFVTSSLLPRSGATKPARNWQQVLANGGPALAFSTIGLVAAEPTFLLAAVASIAAATADTWSTELGRCFGGTPRSVRSWQPVPAGTSGAISAIGTLATVAGAATIALLALLFALILPGSPAIGFREAAIVAVAGTLGSVVDTVLGATLQARFVCTRCGYRSESDGMHLPGHHMVAASGLSWVTNSVVNLAAALAGASASLLLS